MAGEFLQKKRQKISAVFPKPISFLSKNIDEGTVNSIFIKRRDLKYILAFQPWKVVAASPCVINADVGKFGIAQFFVTNFITA